LRSTEDGSHAKGMVSFVDDAAGTGSSAIDKTLTVLESLAQHNRVTDIAIRSGLSKSTVHRILQSLVARGFARADGNGGYLPGPRILTLAGMMMQRFDPAQQAATELRDLRDSTGLAVHFAVRAGDEAVYVAKLDGRRSYQMRSRVGMSIALHTTAIGKAILANLPIDECDEVISRLPLTAITEHSITSPAELRRQLDDARTRGYAVDGGENDPGIVCVGAAVFDYSGAVLGGVSVSALSFDLDVHDPAVIAAVLASARQMSLTLGAPN
jgi:IclR family acetate operon transcriptional repressor